MNDQKQSLPNVASAEDWKRALDEHLVEQKALTRQLDELSAKRRRLPMVKIEKQYTLRGALGERSLIEMFEGRRQLIVYHFMFASESEAGCPGCSWVVDAMTHAAHLNARDTSLILVSRAPLEKLHHYRDRMGWSHPWYSSFETDFNTDMGVTVEGDEWHGVSVFVRDGDDIFRTYFTGDRGVEQLGSHWTYLDLTPFGRQEAWEDSPAGWPQTSAYDWIRRHDDY